MRIDRRTFFKASTTPTTVGPVSYLPTGIQRWSDPATWGGSLPVAGDPITLGPGVNILFDLPSSPALGLVTLNGAVIWFDVTQAQTFTTTGLSTSGSAGQLGGLVDGDPTDPRLFALPLNIVLNGPMSSTTLANRTNGGLNSSNPLARGMVLGDYSRFETYTETATYTAKLADHAAAGATSLTLGSTISGKAGQRLLIAPTQFYANSLPEVIPLSANVSGTTASLATGTAAHRFGKLQYVNKTANSTNTKGQSVLNAVMGYTDTGYRHSVDPQTPYTVDQRATVAVLDRPIVISAPNDADWTTYGFGVRIMTTGLNSVIKVNGIRMFRCGQKNIQTGYPFHWHDLSYNISTGAFIGDAQNSQYIRNSVVESSQNRGFVIHGTCGVTVDSCIAHDVLGMSFFLEDGVERRNFITNNIASYGHRTTGYNQAGGGALKIFEGQFAAGFWLTNPDNTVTGNEGFGMDGLGCWNSYATQAFGTNATAIDQFTGTAINPNAIAVLLFSNNSWHSNQYVGRQLDGKVTDELGNTISDSFRGTGPFSFDANWKNQQGGYENRVHLGNYQHWTQSDNLNQDFFGAQESQNGGFINGCLLVATTLNQFETIPSSTEPKSGGASYHASLQFQNCTLVGYGRIAPVYNAYGVRGGIGGGGISMWDFYLRPLEDYWSMNSGNEYLSSIPGELMIRSELDPNIGAIRDDPNAGTVQAFRIACAGYGAPTGFVKLDGNTLPYGGNDTGDTTAYGWNAAPADATRMAALAFGTRLIPINQSEGDAWLECQKLNTTDSDVVLAMDPTVYAGQGPQQAQMAFRARIKSNGAIYFGSGATADAALPTPHTVPAGSSSLVRLYYQASSGSVLIQSNDSGAGYVTRYTFPSTSAGPLYRYIGCAYSGSTSNDVVRNAQASRHQYWKWPLTSAFWDGNGYWAAAGSYLIPNIPFCTYGLTTTPILVDGSPYHVATTTPFIGVSIDSGASSDHGTMSFCDTEWYEPLAPQGCRFQVARVNPANNASQGNWDIWNTLEVAWTPFRNFVMAAGGEYVLSWPDNPVATRQGYSGSLSPKTYFYEFQVYNYQFGSAANAILWLEWPNAVAPQVNLSRSNFNADGTVNSGDIGANFAATLPAAASIAALRSSTTSCYFQDTSRSLVGICFGSSMPSALHNDGSLSFNVSVIQHS